MNNTSAKIVADSIYGNNKRLITFQLRYPRIIHAEVLTYGSIAKNSSSSRAIPAMKMIDNVETAPFIPKLWIKPHKGMAGHELYSVEDSNHLINQYTIEYMNAMCGARKMHGLGASKQVCNRMIEPYSYIDVIITAEYGIDGYGLNQFFKQREPKYPAGYNHHVETERDNFLNSTSTAQWEIQVLAEMMKDAVHDSIPIQKGIEEWHIPYDNVVDCYDDIMNRLRKSTVRCARVSYSNHLGTIDDSHEAYDKYIDLNQYEHDSPFEHINKVGANGLGRFHHWTQLRHSTARQLLTDFK